MKGGILVLLKSVAKLPLDSRRQQGFTEGLDTCEYLQPRRVIVRSLFRHQIFWCVLLMFIQIVHLRELINWHYQAVLEFLRAEHPVEIGSGKFKYQPQEAQVLKNPTLNSQNSRYKNATLGVFSVFLFQASSIHTQLPFLNSGRLRSSRQNTLSYEHLIPKTSL